MKLVVAVTAVAIRTVVKLAVAVIAVAVITFVKLKVALTNSSSNNFCEVGSSSNKQKQS